MSKKIDLNHSVFDLVKEYPELVDIMIKLGFTEISKKAMLHSVGRIMTIPKGAKMKNIPMVNVISALIENGFELIGEMPEIKVDISENDKNLKMTTLNRTDQLKNFLRRLGAGEDLESVRRDFIREFKEVEAIEIMKAEQELIKEGTPITEVQKLCDIHSALFHGKTREERIFNAEKAVMDSIKKEKIKSELLKKDSFQQKEYMDKKTKEPSLNEILGHPLQMLTRENEAISELLKEFRTTKNISLLVKFRDLSIHYAKKGDLLYPLLNVKYEISGPSNVMWSVDDEIRDDLRKLLKDTKKDDVWFEKLQTVLDRVEEMIYKEQNILFPICATNFTKEEWISIYRDLKDYDICFGVEKTQWDEGEIKSTQKPSFNGEIVMPGGHMNVEQLTALLNTIPLEITFVDADNINRYFNEGPKIFKRPNMAIDREVFSCHPPKIEPMVREIIDSFRNEKRDHVTVWMEKEGRTMLVKYLAVRDHEKKYLGTLEIVQDMEFVKEHFNIND